MPKPAIRFKTLLEIDVPKTRKSKHKDILASILSDLDQLKAGSAFKVPLAELGSSKANVRSALNRAARNRKFRVATASDDSFLYIWNES